MKRNLLFIIILLVGCLTQFASDIYTPAVPAIAQTFHTPINLVQWSMAIYMFGVAISQVFYGVISEGIGRKGPLLTGLLIMFVGTFICILATNIDTLIIGRLIQGIGTGAGTTMWRAIFRDVYTGDDLAKYGSYLAAGVTLIIPTAPAVGAYLQHYFTWRATFVFLIIYTIIALLMVLYSYRETSQHHHPRRLKITFIKNTFRELLTNRVFMGTSFASFMTYGGLFSWMTAAPVLLIHLAGMHAVAFGWFLFFGVGSAYALAGYLSGRLVKRFGMNNLMRFGWIMMIVASMMLLIGYFLWGIHIWNIAPMMVLYYFGAMFIFPNANAHALNPFGKIAGYASSLYSVIQIGGGAILSGIIAHLPEPNQIPLAIVILSAAAIAWICFEVFVAPKVKAAIIK